MTGFYLPIYGFAGLSLLIIKLSIDSLLAHQGLVIASFDDFAIIQDNDMIRQFRRRNPMGNNHGSPIFHDMLQG